MQSSGLPNPSTLAASSSTEKSKDSSDKRTYNTDEKASPAKRRKLADGKYITDHKKKRSEIIDHDDSSDEEDVENKTADYIQFVDDRWKKFKDEKLNPILKFNEGFKSNCQNKIEEWNKELKELITDDHKNKYAALEENTKKKMALDYDVQIQELDRKIAKEEEAAKAKGKDAKSVAPRLRVQKIKKESDKKNETYENWRAWVGSNSNDVAVLNHQNEIESKQYDIKKKQNMIDTMLNETQYKLSFVVHAAGILLLYSKEVEELYRPEKMRNLSNNLPKNNPFVFRKTLAGNHQFSSDNPYQFFANLHLSNCSQKRAIKNFRDASLFVGYKSHRLWVLNNNDKAGVRETQQITSGYSRLDEVQQVGAYTEIKSLISNLISMFKTKNINVDDAKIAQWVRDYFKGNAIPAELNILPECDRMLALNLVSGLSYLLFGCEVARNPASLVIHQMMLDLIIANKFKWNQIDYEMPMATKEAVASARYLNDFFKKYMPYSYQYEGTQNQNVLDRLICLESNIVALWFEQQPVKLSDSLEEKISAANTNNSSKKLSEYMQMICEKFKNWFGDAPNMSNKVGLVV